MLYRHSECGCEANIYEDGSIPNWDVTYCHEHSGEINREVVARLENLLGVCVATVRILRERLIVASPWGEALVEELEKQIEKAQAEE